MSYANVTATLALVVAIGGGALATAGGGGGSSVTGGHIIGVVESSDGEPVAKVRGVLRVKGSCSTGDVQPQFKNVSSRTLSFVRISGGSSTTLNSLAPGEAANFGVAGGVTYTEFTVFPTGESSRPIATAFVTTIEASMCEDASIAAQVIAAD